MEEGKINNGQQPTPGVVISPGGANDNNTPIAPSPQPEQVPVVNSQNAPGSITVSQDGFSWTGPEFARRDKSSSWYMAFVAAAIILGGGIYFLTKDIVSSSAITVAILILAVYNLRKPKDITYALSDFGVSIGNKRFSYDDFRSFTVSIEGAYLTVTFLPLRRFATTAGLFFAGKNEDEDHIVNFLAERMPMEKYSPDLVDRLMRQIGL